MLKYRPQIAKTGEGLRPFETPTIFQLGGREKNHSLFTFSYQQTDWFSIKETLLDYSSMNGTMGGGGGLHKNNIFTRLVDRFLGLFQSQDILTNMFCKLILKYKPLEVTGRNWSQLIIVPRSTLADKVFRRNISTLN